MFITNNGSIGLHHPFHHIYNFGDVSLFIGMGSILKEATVDSDGKARMKRWLPLGMTADERVCSGAHYAEFFLTMKHLLDHPEELEVAPESVKFDPKCEYHVPKVKKAEEAAKQEKSA
jgi:pyruvate/2-oxoglutarate dehydrogenase complex dihydrolipoamide acyltransferase (E2) component